jgi:hypothetical protein
VMDPSAWKGALEGESAEDTAGREKVFLESLPLLEFVRGLS